MARSLRWAVVLPLLIGVVPANGEDAGIYAFINSQQRERPILPISVAPHTPLRLEIAPRGRARKPAPLKARETAATVVMPIKPKPMGEVSNPVPALLADETLRPGDIVVFPDGAHVFRGQPGRRHGLRDFVKLTHARRLASVERKFLVTMRVGRNDAWSVERSAPAGKIAATLPDIDATGSTRKGSRARR